MVKVVLIDDHALLRQGLAGLVNSFEGYTVMFEANNGKHFIKLLDPQNMPDLVLTDVNMPEMDGFETALWLSANYPKLKFIALTMLNQEKAIIKMLRNGAKGYLLKDSEILDFKQALDDVMYKGFYINTIVYKYILDTIHGNKLDEETEQEELMKLSDREKEFLCWLSTDISYKEIAAVMYLSPRTIDGYRDTLFEKLKVASRIGLVLFAIKNGIAKL